SSAVSPLLLFSLTRPLPRSTPFPYTTLFRSGRVHEPAGLVLLDTPRRSAVVEKRVVVNPVAPRIRYTGTCGRGDPNTLVAVKDRSEEHTSELQSRENLVCRLLLEKKKAEEST